jgi:hypothetical protein
MRALWPSFKLASWRCGEARWVGSIRPTDASMDYNVSISYRLGRRPRILVTSPPLQRREGEKIPHLHKDGDLCLHLPAEWDSNMLIAETIVPWATLWLYHYEVWHATGEWLGGGVHAPASRSAASRVSLTAGAA